jgi:hypothetical protein
MALYFFGSIVRRRLPERDWGARGRTERYDRAIDDIFAVQDDITLNTVAAIKPNLRQAEIERVKRHFDRRAIHSLLNFLHQRRKRTKDFHFDRSSVFWR